MKTQIYNTFAMSNVSYMFYEIPAAARCDEVYGYNGFIASTYGSGSPTLSIYATASQSTDQFTNENKIATVTFGSGSGFIIGDVTLIDNGKALGGKSYIACVTPTSTSKAYIINFTFSPADTVKFETGSNFQECYPMLYNGEEFTPCLIKRYNGTAFEECTHIEFE